MHELHSLLCIVACNDKERGNLWDHFTTIQRLGFKETLTVNDMWLLSLYKLLYYGFSLARWYTWYQRTGFAESAQHRMKNHKLHIDFFIWKSKFAYCCCQVVVLFITGGLLFYTLHGVPHTHVQDSPPGRDITVIITTCYLGNITAEHIIRGDILLCNLGNKLLDMSYELFISI